MLASKKLRICGDSCARISGRQSSIIFDKHYVGKSASNRTMHSKA